MVKCVNKSIVLFSVFLLLLMIVPSAFASDAVDNQTVISSDEQIEISAVDDGGVIYSHGEDTNVLTGSNDIYFNASAESDGRGTQSSPYKYLQYNRLTSGCTAHFADGTYELDSKKGIYSSMTFMGQSAQNTIIKFNGIAFNVGDGYTLTLKDLTAGNYDVTVSYPGDNNYYNQVIKTNFTVDINKKVNLNISDIVMIYKDGTRMIAVLTDYLGNPIANATLYFTINGKTYVKTTDDKGTASMGLNLVSKVYDATISYNGSDKYDAVSKNITVTINPTIISEDLVKMYQNATRFYAKFTDSTGKALANSEVRFNIHGVFYTKTTNKDGVADLGIMLRPGTYILTAYNPVTGEEKGFNITVKSLIVQNDLTKYYLNASRFQATIYNKDGSLAVNKEVTFNINGVFYTKITNSEGIATLNIKLLPAEYIITNYNLVTGEENSNKVTVKSLLVDNSDLVKYYLNESKYTLKVIGKDGKVAAGQEVSFNINGVFYHRVSDENGIVSLGIKLRPGDYIVTAEYEGCRVSNNVKVLPTLVTKDLVMKYMDGSSFTAQTLDGQGNPLANQKISFNVNGVFYHRTTDENGMASLHIRLNPGKYIITSIWNEYQIGNNITIA